MVKVAVAGGTGALGRTIIEAILATKKHDVFVLSRSVSTQTRSAVLFFSYPLPCYPVIERY